jgi:hypothetical protein
MFFSTFSMLIVLMNGLFIFFKSYRFYIISNFTGPRRITLHAHYAERIFLKNMQKNIHILHIPNHDLAMASSTPCNTKIGLLMKRCRCNDANSQTNPENFFSICFKRELFLCHFRLTYYFLYPILVKLQSFYILLLNKPAGFKI